MEDKDKQQQQPQAGKSEVESSRDRQLKKCFTDAKRKLQEAIQILDSGSASLD